MIKNCALYLPNKSVPLKKLFPNGTDDSGLFKKASYFEYETEDGVVRLSLNPPKELSDHLHGFKGYVSTLPNSAGSIVKAKALIDGTETVIGVEFPEPVSPQSDMFNSLMYLINQQAGFMFVADSVLLADGSFLVGPQAQDFNNPEKNTPPETLIEVNEEQCRHIGEITAEDKGRKEERESIYRMLAERGFRCSRWLPLYRSEATENSLRPQHEIGSKLFAMATLFLWASTPDHIASDEQIKSILDCNNLNDYFDEDEHRLLSLSRDQAREEFGGIIGWRLENMWSLSWIFGFEPAPSFYHGQISDEIISCMLLDFLNLSSGTVEEFITTHNCRAANDVSFMEDLFYCAHNAVRSAQLGEDTVPDYFHPVVDGGAIHERRHALTWALSPFVPWEETDLST